MTFTANEDAFGFTQAAINISGNTGIISQFSGSGKIYTATFTPNSNNATDGSVINTIKILANKFNDGAGNSNPVSEIFNWSRDTRTPVLTSVNVKSNHTDNTIAK